MTLPTKLTTIGDYAFYSCENLQEIELPEGLLNIGACVFYDCTSLREITIPKSVISIGNDLVNKNNIYPTIYVYSGSYAQTYVVEKRYYRHVVI